MHDVEPPMKSRFLMSLLALGVGLGGASASAKDVPFAKVKDWDISRQSEGATPQCMMARAYKDADDENASSVVIATTPGHLVISLGYQGWSHDKEGRTVVFLVGGKIVDLRSKWQADDTQMTGEFTEALLPHLLGADTIVLRFKDGDADFKIPAFAEAFETLKRCHGEPQPAVATAMPGPARIADYASGLYFQKALRECDVASTNRQRADLDAKLAAMRPEMSPLQALIEIEINKRAADTNTPFCPKPEKAAAFSGSPRPVPQPVARSLRGGDRPTRSREGGGHAALRDPDQGLRHGADLSEADGALRDPDHRAAADGFRRQARVPDTRDGPAHGRDPGEASADPRPAGSRTLRRLR